MSDRPLLEVHNLTISYPAEAGRVRAVRDLSLRVCRGRTLALVGESGSGKSTTALALLGLLDAGARSEAGRILYDGREVTRLTERAWRRLRGREIGILFQDPRAALNPVLTVGAQLVEAIRAHQALSRQQARRQAVHALAAAGIAEAEFQMHRYPFELSTGMCQRVGIALAVCNRPRLLIADEPASALDPVVQARITELLGRLKKEYGLALLLISHDLQLVAGLADEIAVVYGGRIVERGRAAQILAAPAHPYTRGLLASRPDLNHHCELRPLPVIPGTPPPAGSETAGCSFAPRCGLAEPRCTQSIPPDAALEDGRSAACFRASPAPP